MRQRRRFITAAFECVPGRQSFLVEGLEQRLLFARLSDFAGLTPAATGQLLGLVSANGAAGQQQPASLTMGDGLTDSIWLANHVDLPTLDLLDKVDGALQQMVAQWLRDGKTLANMSIGNASPLDQYEHDGNDPLVTIRSAQPTALAAQSRALGFNVTGSVENGDAGVVDLYAPVSRITELAGMAGVKSIDAEQNLPTDAGSVSSTWPASANIPQMLLDLPGTTGTGIKYGIISDSFNNKGGMAAGIASGDLPAGTTVLHDAAGGGIDEGRAMAEVLYDAAPGSNILFYDQGGGKTGMVTAINALAAAGANVIVDDTNVLEGTYQDDVVSQAIDNVVLNQKIPYFTSSGNRNGQTYSGTFSEGTTVNRYDAFDGAGDEALNLTIPATGTLSADLFWGQKLGGASTDLDFYLRNAADGSVLASNIEGNIGGDAITTLGYTNNTGAAINAYLQVYNFSGPTASLPLFILTFPGNGTTNSDPLWGGPAAYGHHMSEFGFGTAAVQPGSPNTIETFSSHGGVPILFNDDGTPVSGGSVIRNQPALAACDGINTTFFGQFFGTSCAAPDAAAIAGLLLQAAGGGGKLTYSQMRDMLSNGAFDLGSAGYDLTYGAGRIDALASVIAAHENLGSQTYIELNQFGQGSFTANMSLNVQQPSVYFAFDTAGNVPLLQTSYGSSGYAYGGSFEYGDPGSASLLQTVRVDSGVIASFPGWSVVADTRHSLSTFARSNVDPIPGGTADDMVFSIDGPDASLVSINVPDTTGVGRIDSNLSSRYDTDYYLFVTPASYDTATGITIASTFSGGLDGVISVFNTSGVQLARADSGAANATESLTSAALLPSTIYIVRVGSYQGQTSGSYQLGICAPKNLSNAMPNIGGFFTGSPPLIPFGKTATSPNAQGTHVPITGNSSIASYIFGADSQLGGSFTIAASSSAFDTTLVVYEYDQIFGSFNGTLMAYNDDFSGTNSQVSFTAKPGLRYIVCVKPFNNAGGAYTLTANYGGTPSETNIPLNSAGDGSINTGTIPAFGEANTYKFTAPNVPIAGATISLTNQSGDGDIYLFDDAGNLLGGDNTGGTGNETITLASLTQGAVYHITVIPENYAAPLTQSTVSVNVVVIANPTAPSLDSGSDTGLFSNDGITNRSTNLVFFVTTTPGAFVRLFRNGILVAGPTAAGIVGLISISDPGPVPDGTYTYTATAAGTASSTQTPASLGTQVTVDTQAPALSDFGLTYDYFGTFDQSIFFQFDNSGITFNANSPAIKNLTTGVTLNNAVFLADDLGLGLFADYYNPTAGTDRFPSGNYEARIPAGAFTDTAGNPNPLMVRTFFFQDGDANHDGKVDVGDLGILATNYGLTNKAFSLGDFNYDGLVDVGDLGILATYYGVNLGIGPSAGGTFTGAAAPSSTVVTTPTKSPGNAVATTADIPAAFSSAALDSTRPRHDLLTDAGLE